MDLATKAIELARTKVGVEEVPRGSNRGRDVDEFLRVGGGLDPSAGKYAWCAAFVSWAIIRAGEALGAKPQFRRSARALGLLEKNPALIIDTPEPNSIFVIAHGDKGLGHTGFVIALDLSNPGVLLTLEGNSDSLTGSRTGGSCVLRTRRIDECKSFLQIR